MRVSLNFLVRIVGMVVLAYVGYSIATSLSGSNPTETQQQATLLLILSGAGLGLLTTHRWTLEPLQEGLQAEKEAALELAGSPISANLIGVFFMNNRLARDLGVGAAPDATRRAVADAVHAVYLGAACAAALAFVVLLTLAPRRFPVRTE